MGLIEGVKDELQRAENARPLLRLLLRAIVVRQLFKALAESAKTPKRLDDNVQKAMVRPDRVAQPNVVRLRQQWQQTTKANRWEGVGKSWQMAAL